MAISRNFGFGADEAMLRDSAKRFFADHCSADKIHAQVASDYDIDRSLDAVWDRDLWLKVVELGWLAACVPERAGGIGMSPVAAVALAEEAGKAAFPSPLIATLASTFVLNACEGEAADKALGQIAEGMATSLAITDSKGSWDTADTDVAVDAGELNGSAYFVQDAQKAAAFVVSAQSDAGVGLYLVQADASGVDIQPNAIVDLTRDQATVQFSGVSATELAAPGRGAEALNAALPAILSVVSADMVGAGEWLLQTTAEYARTRMQFDRPIGFFQAIKHPLVNVMVDVDRAKSLTYAAACAAAEDPDRAEVAARMAKSAASDMAQFSASRAVQFHGGIGFTWECYVHVFFKRQMHNAALYGDGRYQRRRLAPLLTATAA